MLNIFHISFRVYLQEEILAKMKKPPLVSEDDWEGIEDEDIVDDQSKSLGSVVYIFFCSSYEHIAVAILA